MEIKKETCQMASPDIDVKSNDLEYGFFLQDDSHINIVAMIEMLQDSICKYNTKNNQELVSDIEIKFNCSTAIQTEHGIPELCFKTCFLSQSNQH